MPYVAPPTQRYSKNRAAEAVLKAQPHVYDVLRAHAKKQGVPIISVILEAMQYYIDIHGLNAKEKSG